MSILVEQDERVVIIRLNRPKALNALNAEIMNEMIAQMETFDRDPNVGCIVVTGSEKAFAAGADIKEMSKKSYLDMVQEDYLAEWHKLADIRTPKIAAVSGYALGGGCELAMMCDIIYASETAKFGQPEIKLGIIPGMGGSQRLTKMVGKAKAMDLVLTGRMMDAEEAERAGLVARVFPAETFMDEVMTAAKTVAGYGKIATVTAREAVDRAMELSLKEGLLFERRVYHALWATEDAQEGMQAFIEKRAPNFKGK